LALAAELMRADLVTDGNFLLRVTTEQVTGVMRRPEEHKHFRTR